MKNVRVVHKRYNNNTNTDRLVRATISTACGLSCELVTHSLSIRIKQDVIPGSPIFELFVLGSDSSTYRGGIDFFTDYISQYGSIDHSGTVLTTQRVSYKDPKKVTEEITYSGIKCLSQTYESHDASSCEMRKYTMNFSYKDKDKLI